MPVYQDSYQRATGQHNIRHFACLSEKINKGNCHSESFGSYLPSADVVFVKDSV